MKKLLALGAVLALGASVSVAQAQEKKKYVIGSLGIYAVSGGETVGATTETLVEEGYTQTHKYDHTTEASEDGNNIRIGYGYHLNQNLSLELGYVDFGDVKVEDTAGKYIVTTTDTDDTDDGDGSYDNRYEENTAASTTTFTLDVTDISAVYYKPLNEKANLTFRGGIAMYQWIGEDGKDVKENDYVKTASGTTPLLGIGAEFGNIHAELRLYDLAYIAGDEDYYTTAGVLSVGYKLRF